MLSRLLTVAALVPLLAACAAIQASAQEKEITPQQTAVVQATCAKIMRLREGQPEFIACVSSLSDSLAYQMVADYAADAYRDCAKLGLRRETPDFSRCVLDRENAAHDVGHSPSVTARLDAAYVTPSDSSPDDYFRTTNTMRHRREQYACGQLGLEPSSEPLASCVKNLDTQIFESEFPPG
jgi:hypothetical protein